MEKKSLLLRLVFLVTAMMCALGAAAAEAYACYTESNTTLTFYYDNYRNSRTGTTYDLNVESTQPDWYDDGTNFDVTKVVFNSTFAGARPTSTYSWFYMMENLHSITGLNYLNTSQVTNMASMFSYCYELTNLDLGSFNTSSVTNMGSMFYSCYNLQTIYTGSGWSTAAVTYSANMFNNCSSLVGGMGTTYSSNRVNATYARIDGGPSNPGYFTEKNASLRGDVNGDNDVTIADVSALIDYLLTGDPTGVNLAAANCNGDSDVSIADVSALIDYLLTGNW